MLLLELFQSMPDPRRGQGQRYALAPFLTLILLSILSGATSYRKMALFMSMHRQRLNHLLGIHWATSPSYVAIGHLLVGLDTNALEQVLRRQARQFSNKPSPQMNFAIDGKVLCGSAQRLEDQRAQYLLSVFSHEDPIVLGHFDMDEKSNEIPAAQTLIETLGLRQCVYTLDAMHCQKNAENRQNTRL